MECVVLIATPMAARAERLRQLALAEGWSPVVVRDAPAAEMQLERVSPRLLITDLNLPGGNAFALLERGRRMPKLRRTAAIVLCAFAALRAEAWRHRERLGLVDVLADDAPDDELRVAMQRALAGQPARAPAPAAASATTSLAVPRHLDPARMARLAAISLDHAAPPEESLQRLVEDTASAFGVPMAAISVVYDDREWLQAYVGLTQRTFPLESSLCRHVVDAGEPLVVHDASVHAALAQMSVVQAGLVRGYAGAPVVTAAGDIRGTLCLFDSRPLDISAAELDTLVTLARRVAGELALRAERERVVRAADLRDAIVAALDVGIVVTDGARRVTHANQAFAAFIGLSPRDLVERDRDAVVELLAERSDHPDAVREAMRVHRQGPFLAGADLVLARPEARILRWSAKPLAAAGDGAQLETWSDVTAQVALERARERDAITDVLTGLHNRRAGERALLAEIARARRSHSPLSLLYVDVDHFKRHNDEHGHAFGDAVLRVVAAALRENARVSDVVCRWGGEEFVVALPGETVDGALVCAERMRAAVEAQSSLARAAVTVSIGAAELGAGDDLEHLLAAADDALYAAKHGGRNRVRAHTPRRLLSQLR